MADAGMAPTPSPLQPSADAVSGVLGFFSTVSRGIAAARLADELHRMDDAALADHGLTRDAISQRVFKELIGEDASAR